MTEPANKARFERGIDRLATAKTDTVFRLIPFMLILECWAICKAYYGSPLRALRFFALFELQMWLSGRRATLLCFITDHMGWTKLYPIPGIPESEAKMRHGWKCSGSPNCSNVDCIGESLPTWFRKITRNPRRNRDSPSPHVHQPASVHNMGANRQGVSRDSANRNCFGGLRMKFDLEDEFDNYMRKVAPSVEQHAVQYRESRRAFIAGARRVYIHMTRDVVRLSDSDAEKELQRLDNEMCAYWKLACDDKD